jgi:hypothetical protein
MMRAGNRSLGNRPPSPKKPDDVHSTDLFAGAGPLDIIANKPGTYSRGVFRSTDNGSKWSAINSGLPLVKTRILKEGGTRVNRFWSENYLVGTCIKCLALNDNYLFAATWEGIVWRLPLKDLPAGK